MFSIRLSIHMIIPQSGGLCSTFFCVLIFSYNYIDSLWLGPTICLQLTLTTFLKIPNIDFYKTNKQKTPGVSIYKSGMYNSVCKTFKFLIDISLVWRAMQGSGETVCCDTDLSNLIEWWGRQASNIFYISKQFSHSSYLCICY